MNELAENLLNSTEGGGGRGRTSGAGALVGDFDQVILHFEDFDAAIVELNVGLYFFKGDLLDHQVLLLVGEGFPVGVLGGFARVEGDGGLDVVIGKGDVGALVEGVI